MSNINPREMKQGKSYCWDIGTGVHAFIFVRPFDEKRFLAIDRCASVWACHWSDAERNGVREADTPVVARRSKYLSGQVGYGDLDKRVTPEDRALIAELVAESQR